MLWRCLCLAAGHPVPVSYDSSAPTETRA